MFRSAMKIACACALAGVAVGLTGCEDMDDEDGSLLGGMMGMAAVASMGGDADQMMQGATLGANAVSTDSALSQSLNQAHPIDQIGQTNSVDGTGVGGVPAVGASDGTGPGAVQVGSYPMEGPYEGLDAACSGLGSGDTQLSTMCQQADMLWNAYQNAYNQGYSQSQSQRTYNAYQAAAANAVSFRRQAQ